MIKRFIRLFDPITTKLILIFIAVGIISLLGNHWGIPLMFYLFIGWTILQLVKLGKDIQKRIIYDPSCAWRDQEEWKQHFRFDDPVIRIKKMNYQFHLQQYRDKQALHHTILQRLLLCAASGWGIWVLSPERAQPTEKLTLHLLGQLTLEMIASLGMYGVMFMIFHVIWNTQLQNRLKRSNRDWNESLDQLLREQEPPEGGKHHE